jgi:hypothetical protein
LVGLAHLLVLIVALIGLILDPRVITGAPAWLKPAKFAVSITIYSFTFLWLLSFVSSRPRLMHWAANVTAIGFIVEIIIIAGQAARGTASHFNVSTALDAALFAAMGWFILGVWLMNLLAAILLLRERLPDPAFAWALRLGLVITLLGASVGILMVIPTAAQRTAMAAGERVTAAGAHSVGVADGGPGLPIVGWSTEGGDLRAPHFIGLHAMQVLPLVGWLLARRRFRHLSQGHRVALVWTAAFTHLGLMLLLTWQALRGQSVAAPDAATLEALGALIGVVTLATAMIFARARWQVAPA